MRGGKGSRGHARGHRVARRARRRAAFSINFRLRDWLISRQRYWGNPIPAIHCPTCGLVPVPERAAAGRAADGHRHHQGRDARRPPRVLRDDVPAVRRRRQRETDTMDTFTCSIWYYLRYCDARNDAAPFDARQGGLLDAGRPVHRRHRARDPAPAVLAVLHEGASATWACSASTSRSRTCSRRGWSSSTARR